MRIGAHVRAGKGLVPALQHGEEIGAEVVQVFTQSPRMWKPSQYGARGLGGLPGGPGPTRGDGDVLPRHLSHQPGQPGSGAHGQVPRLPDRQPGHGRGHGSDGLVLHIGSHRGRGFDVALPQVVGALIEALDSVEAVGDPCPILLENAAGAGDTVGRSFEELAMVIEAAAVTNAGGLPGHPAPVGLGGAVRHRGGG